MAYRNIEDAKKYAKAYRKKNKVKIKIDNKAYNERNAKAIKKKAAIYRDENREKINADAKTRLQRIKIEEPERYEALLVKHRAANKAFNDANPEIVKKRNSLKSKEQIRTYHQRSYYKNHKETLEKYRVRNLKYINELSTCYVNSLFRNRGVNPKDATPEIREAFKIQLQIKRELGINN